MPDGRPIKVMIVDDHPIVRDGLKNMLLAFDDLHLVGEAGDGREALVACLRTEPDVILMDMIMPGMDGIAATRTILECRPQMRILMLTSFVEDSAVQSALQAGAIGYLMKNVTINMLAAAIRSAYAGQPFLSPEATTALIRAKTDPIKLGGDLSPRTRGPGADRRGPEQRTDRRAAGDQHGHSPPPRQRLSQQAGRRQPRPSRGPGHQTPSGPITPHEASRLIEIRRQDLRSTPECHAIACRLQLLCTLVALNVSGFP